ncbi:MAG: hypothetical protein QME16_00430 [Planctomycetota bacterium]|nr:hypothetical protein [Planctomycetota bacterium]
MSLREPIYRLVAISIYSKTMRLLRRYAPRNDTFGHFVNSLILYEKGVCFYEKTSQTRVHLGSGLYGAS